MILYKLHQSSTGAAAVFYPVIHEKKFYAVWYLKNEFTKKLQMEIEIVANNLFLRLDKKTYNIHHKNSLTVLETYKVLCKNKIFFIESRILVEAET